MADRIPLVISDNKLREIASADNLKVGKVVPVSDGTYDLGDSSVKFNRIYVGAQGIYTGTLYLKDSGGTLAAFNASDGSAASIAGGVSGLTWTSGTNTLAAASADGSSVSVVVDEHDSLTVTNDIEVGGDVKTGSLYIKDVGSNTIKFTQSDGTTAATISSDNIDATTIANGNSNVVVASNSDVTIDAAGSTIVTVASSGVTLDQNTTVNGTIDVTGLASLDGGIDVDGAFTVANTSGNISTTGTLAAGNTDITGTLDVSSNVVIGGNLQVNGTEYIADVETFAVSDNLFYLNHAESSGSPTQSVDIGWAGNYNEGGTYAHAGLFRDATDQRFKIFDGYTPEPSGAEINTGHASFALADFQAGTFIGALSGNATTASTWQTARDITLSGDISGSTTGVDGSGNITISNMAIGAGTVSSTELASASTLLIKNSAGTTVKTIIGAGS
jgi:hypothetical protein